MTQPKPDLRLGGIGIQGTSEKVLRSRQMALIVGQLTHQVERLWLLRRVLENLGTDCLRIRRSPFAAGAQALLKPQTN